MTTNYVGGFPQTVSAPRQESAVIKWLLNDLISRKDCILSGLSTDTVYEVGTVLGQISFGTPTSVAKTGNTGNGTLTVSTSKPLLSGAQAGAYTVACKTAATNGGTFSVSAPDGTVLDEATVGAAYTHQIGFTITDGSTDFVVGDTFTVTVPSVSDGNYVQFDPAGVDGRQTAARILSCRAFIPATTDVRVPTIDRDAVVVAEALIWIDGITDAQIASALDTLAIKSITTLSRG